MIVFFTTFATSSIPTILQSIVIASALGSVNSSNLNLVRSEKQKDGVCKGARRELVEDPEAEQEAKLGEERRGEDCV